jgi:hypothetical protein
VHRTDNDDLVARERFERLRVLEKLVGNEASRLEFARYCLCEQSKVYASRTLPSGPEIANDHRDCVVFRSRLRLAAVRLAQFLKENVAGLRRAAAEIATDSRLSN